MTKTSRAILLITTIISIVGCARMGQPDGGWFDETPPSVIGCMPADKATNVDSRKINIYFDEFIKIDNPTEKVVVSPPQLEAPDIKGAASRITVLLNDSLKPNTTYTIDFSDAISDNNEGNPLGNYTYSFSTGGHIDTLEVSGYVLEAENLEPIKGILVGLYDNLNDTAFTSLPMLRVSRTDSRGRFVIKGVAPGEYRIYALQDADGNYSFSQKSEKLAFSHEIIVPTSKPDIRQDTIWRDSLHIDNIVRVGYTHFLPDDIVLKAFTEIQTDRYLIKTERKEAECFSMIFSYGHEELPQIEGLNFDADNGLILETNLAQDTLTYWMSDTTLVNQDTLRMVVTYHATDTLGMLQQQTDTLEVLSKNPYNKRMKEHAKEVEKWKKQQEKAKKKGDNYIDEMPPTPLSVNIGIPSDMHPGSVIKIESPTPLALVDTTQIHLYMKNDTVWENQPYSLIDKAVEDSISNNQACRILRLRYDGDHKLWHTGTEYRLDADSAAFTDIYGKASLAAKKPIIVKTDENFSSVTMSLIGAANLSCVGQLLDTSEKPVRQVETDNGVLRFEYVKPGDYYLRIFFDDNRNGRWDTGEYANDQQAEAVFYYHEKIECKAKWPLEISWDPTSLPATRQKPTAIVKQKPDKEKKVKNQNAERARKLGIPYIPQRF